MPLSMSAIRSHPELCLARARKPLAHMSLRTRSLPARTPRWPSSRRRAASHRRLSSPERRRGCEPATPCRLTGRRSAKREPRRRPGDGGVSQSRFTLFHVATGTPSHACARSKGMAGCSTSFIGRCGRNAGSTSAPLAARSPRSTRRCASSPKPRSSGSPRKTKIKNAQSRA